MQILACTPKIYTYSFTYQCILLYTIINFFLLKFSLCRFKIHTMLFIMLVLIFFFAVINYYLFCLKTYQIGVILTDLYLNQI